jgi:hypothetical protein
MGKGESSNKPFPIWLLIIIALIVVLGLWSANYFLIVKCVDRGELGDMYGVVNSLFSGLAFAGIIITIFLQSRELKLQREELQETRKEFKMQNTTLRLQRFENTFFSMLSLHHDIVKGIDYIQKEYIEDFVDQSLMAKNETEKVMYQGRDVFEVTYAKLAVGVKNDITIEGINSRYMFLYRFHVNDFDNYFRNLYRIIKLIDTSEFTINPNSVEEFEMKYKYTSIVRSQLSTYELLWLFYNCISENGNEKFKPLIEKYTLFKNIRCRELSNDQHDKLFERSAFQKKYNLNFNK